MDRAMTLGRSIRRAGRGLHEGEPASITLRPAPPNTGRCFRRAGVPIPARLDYVHSTTRSTALKGPGGRVRTVEHLLAALAGTGVDGVWIDISGGPEVPILDGSSAPWVEAIREAGQVGSGWRRRLVVTAPIEVQLGASVARIGPGRGFDLEVEVDFSHRQGGLSGRWRGQADQVFEDELAPARTFGFVDELRALEAAGLIRGADPSNAVLLGGPSPALRWPDEPIRHKALDAVGDWALLNARLDAHIELIRPGHGLHVAAMRALLAQPGAWTWG